TLDTTPSTMPSPGQAGALGVRTLEDGTPYLTDGAGRSLYMLITEPEGQSTCYDACAEAWPPFLATEGATPQAAGGADQVRTDRIGTLERTDGTRQVTYGGRALYYYREDRAAGDRTGQDRTDAWGE